MILRGRPRGKVGRCRETFIGHQVFLDALFCNPLLSIPCSQQNYARTNFMVTLSASVENSAYTAISSPWRKKVGTKTNILEQLRTHPSP